MLGELSEAWERVNLQSVLESEKEAEKNEAMVA